MDGRIHLLGSNVGIIPQAPHLRASGRATTNSRASGTEMVVHASADPSSPKLLADLIRDQQLFTWLELAEEEYTIAKTTNPLECGPNKTIRGFLRAHRGFSIGHARRGVDWLLYLRTSAPHDPWVFVTPGAWTLRRRNPSLVKPETSPEETNRLYGTGFSVEDGNGIQNGWGGRPR